MLFIRSYFIPITLVNSALGQAKMKKLYGIIFTILNANFRFFEQSSHGLTSICGKAQILQCITINFLWKK